MSSKGVPVISKNEVLRNLKVECLHSLRSVDTTNKLKYCSTYLLFPAIFERTVEPEKFCLSVRKERPNTNRRLFIQSNHERRRLLQTLS